MNYYVRISVFLLLVVAVLPSVVPADGLNYRSYIYNTYEIMLFSYEDDTNFEVVRYTIYGPFYEYRSLDKGQHDRIYIPDPPPAADVYEVAASEKFAVLMGDAAVNGKSGYYAMDQEGRFLSTEFYTYVPLKTPDYGYQKCVVFAYEDGTEVTVEYADPNMVYHEVVTDYALSEGENWSSEDLSDKYVHVASNKPISALSCYDTGYFVPSANGRWPKMSICTYV